MSSSEIEFYQKLPKVELHAHLNGSLSLATIDKLLTHHKKVWPTEPIPENFSEIIKKVRNKKMFNLDDPFFIFPIVHRVTDNVEAVSMATYDVIEDFLSEGVHYLELRSTPREVPGRMTKSDYCESVVSGIRRAQEKALDVIVKFLLSVDRRKLETFEETVQLYRQMREKYPDIIAGLDISGDPQVGDLTQILPKLQSLRNDGVKVAVHLAEIPNESETMTFLKYGLDRIGHGTFISPQNGGTEQLIEVLKSKKTPVEVCLTSNICSGTISKYELHHAKYLRDNDIPIIICTDDKGVFFCTLSQEYELAAKHLGWSRKEMYEISLNSLDYIFASESVKSHLKSVWQKWRRKNEEYFS